MRTVSAAALVLAVASAAVVTPGSAGAQRSDRADCAATTTVDATLYSFLPDRTTHHFDEQPEIVIEEGTCLPREWYDEGEQHREGHYHLTANDAATRWTRWPSGSYKYFYRLGGGGRGYWIDADDTAER